MFLTTFWEALLWIMMAAFWLFALGFFIWTFADIFRRRDLTGWGKAGWVALVFVFPLFGCLIYLVVRPKYMDTDPAIAWAPTSGSRMSAAEEITYAQGLLAQGTITQTEFDQIKWNVLH
jgi:Phospholipase_D-nuclease N-terminal